MICRNCGRCNDDSKSKCDGCGASLVPQNKMILGILLCVFLDLIGLIIGLIMYPIGSYERNTFVIGWARAFLCELAVAIIVTIIVLL